MDERFSISENNKYGVILEVSTDEFADEFTDFITESFYVFFDVKFEANCVYYYFGQVSCVEKVLQLVEKFKVK